MPRREQLALVVLLIVLAESAHRPRPPAAKYIIRLVDYDICEPDVASVKKVNFSIRRLKDGSDFLDVDAIVERPAQRWNKFEIVIHRCVDIVSKNTCEYFQRMAWTVGICDLVKMKDMVWTPFVDAFYPPVTCPVKTGLFIARNLTVDLDALLRVVPVKVGGFVWSVFIHLWDQDDVMHMCFRGAGVALRSVKRPRQ